MRGRPGLLSLAVASMIVAASSSAFAVEPATAPAVEAAPEAARAAAPRAQVRLTLSKAASDLLAEARLRRLVDVELEDSAVLVPGMTGPLVDAFLLVWIDVPDPSRAVLQVRASERPLLVRQVSLAGFRPDVAARLVAIATAQMVRSQTSPLRPRKAPAPHKPSPAEIELASRADPALFVGGAASAVLLPEGGRLLAGPSLTVAFRQGGITQRAFARWLGGGGDGGATRWLELGFGGDYRFWQSPSFRVGVGASAAMGSVYLGSALSLDGAVDDHDTWSARATASLSAELHLTGPIWLGLSFEPGAVLRPIAYDDAAGTSRSLGGPWLGLDLALIIDERFGRR